MSSITTSSDTYTRVTERIAAPLARGVRPWDKTWDAAAASITRPLRHNGIPFSGVNTLLLWREAAEKNYISPIWLTFLQAKELGAHIRNDEHGTLVVRGSDDKSYNKGYIVFNAEQSRKLPAHYYVKAEPRDPIATIQHAAAFVAATAATIKHGGDNAFYASGPDCIHIPPRESFKKIESYYATVADGLIRWTAHPSRLPTDLGKRFGNYAQAAEELIAEIGAAFLCADLRIKPQVREENAQYLAPWLRMLNADKRAIFTVASHAQRALDYLHSRQPRTQSAIAPS